MAAILINTISQRVIICIAMSMLMGISVSAQQTVHDWGEWDVIPGKVLIQYKSGKSEMIKKGTTTSGIEGLSLRQIEESVRSEMKAKSPGKEFISLLPDTFIGTFDPSQRDEVLRSLAADPDVLYYEPDRKRIKNLTWGTATPNDPELSNLWGMQRIGAPAAWQKQSSQRAAIRAAVWEGLYDNTHRDLVSQNSPVQNNGQPLSEHATYVSGILVATGNNGLDVVGVANTELVSLGDSATVSGFAALITWAVNNQVNVINMSWGVCGELGCAKCSYTAPSTTEQNAILGALDYIVFVSSAGNHGCNVDDQGRPPLPVSYVGVIGVSALDSNDNLWASSNYGAYVDLTGPGVDIVSTILGNTVGSASGTSASAPHVAGAAAAVLAVEPSYHVRSISRLLELTAEDIGTSGRDDQFGYGVVRADRAVNAIADVYSESGAPCGTGTLLNPYCTLGASITNVPTGGTIGLVKGSFTAPPEITKKSTIVVVGGTVILSP
jgi:thermitase